MRVLKSVLLLPFLGLPVFAADPASVSEPAPERNWALQIDQDVRAVWWRSTRGYPAIYAAGAPGRGSQIYAPISVSFNWVPSSDFKVDFIVRSGWAYGRQSSGGGLTGDVSTLTDTSLTPTITYTGLQNFQPFVSLAVNAPTGRANLKGRQAFTRMDPDLVEVANYGGGLAVGPTVGFNYVLSEATTVTFSVGHTFLQPFSRDSVYGPPGVPLTRINPGNSTTYNAQVVHRAGSWTFSLAGLLTTSGKSTLEGMFESRSGHSFTFLGSAAYMWNAEHNTVVTSSLGFSHRNFIMDPAFAIVREPQNRNSRTVRAAIEHNWVINPTWTVGANASIFMRNKNDYNMTDGTFVPAKTKITAGVSARYKWTEAISLNARLEHFWLHERVKPDVIIPGPFVVPGSGIPKLRSTGLLVAVGSSIAF